MLTAAAAPPNCGAPQAGFIPARYTGHKMKALLDFSPAALFFLAYVVAGNLYTATAVLIAASFALVAVYWFWQRRWHRQHLITALLVAVMGGLTLVVHDTAFIKLKPTVLYAAFSAVLLGSHVIGNKVLMARLGANALPLPDRLWRGINLAWAVFFAGCAVLNLYVAQQYDEATWVKFKTFGFTGLMFLFLLAHAPFVARYLEAPSESESPKP